MCDKKCIIDFDEFSFYIDGITSYYELCEYIKKSTCDLIDIDKEIGYGGMTIGDYYLQLISKIMHDDSYIISKCVMDYVEWKQIDQSVKVTSTGEMFHIISFKDLYDCLVQNYE